MMAELRRQADDAVREASKAMNDYTIAHGHSNPSLNREYQRLERLLDMIDEHITLMQAEDLDAPTADPGDHYAYPVQ